jgi:hypothetical protein
VERLKAEHAAVVKGIELIVLEKEDEVERLIAEGHEVRARGPPASASTQRSRHADRARLPWQAAERAAGVKAHLEDELRQQRQLTEKREEEIRQLQQQLAQNKKAHDEVAAISQRLLGDAQKQIDQLTVPPPARPPALSACALIRCPRRRRRT